MQKWQREVAGLRKALRPEYPDIGGRPGFGDTSDERHGRRLRVNLVRSEQSPALFDYQRDLVAEVVALAGTSERALLALPTGAGKTRTASLAVMEGMACSTVSRACWFAPTLELVQQAFDTFEELWRQFGRAPDIQLTRSLDDVGGAFSVWVGTPHAVLARLRKKGAARPEFDFIVFDEAHMLGARKFRQVVERTASMPRAGGHIPAVLGVSATPGRADPRETEDLVTLFGNRLLKSDALKPNPVRALQNRGVLARLKFRQLTKNPPGAAEEAARLTIVTRACRELASRGKKVLVFAASVAGAVVLAEALNSVNIAATAVHSDLGVAQRQDAIDAFASGRTRVLTNMRLLATGYDCPTVSDIVICSAVGSEILFEQMVGRAARGPLTGGTRSATVWDFDDNRSVHGMPSSYYRFRDFDWA